MDRIAGTIEIDSELVEQARGLNLSIDGLDERAVRLLLQKVDPSGAEARARRWAEENADAIADHNRRIAERGMLSDQLKPRWV